MELVEKAEILAEVWLSAQGDENWYTFFEYNNLGIPYAFGVAYGHILNLSVEGEQQITEAWESLCEKMGIDSQKEYKDFEHMYLTSQP